MMTFVYFIQYLGPKFMKDRNPFDLSRLIMIFNVTQIVYNVWMFNECGDNISLCVCSQMANVCWHYYMSKIIDLLDTVFFVLRKKNNQITPLHLVHHTGMPAVAFSCVRYYPGGHVTLTGLLNTFVHSIMYFYYLIAGLGPSFKKYLWWKQYLTLLQMVIRLQFLIISIHSSFVLIFDCDFDKRPMFYLMVNSLFMFMMFGSFYRQTYMKKTS
uniref:Elongation of very long chain fatty acids protein n=1 Tax=Timema cristinae TaxID=61476 RepID=A0A7R9CEM6_TIMCR|nr:unnamed protein product [Timema cristinae]